MLVMLAVPASCWIALASSRAPAIHARRYLKQSRATGVEIGLRDSSDADAPAILREGAAADVAVIVPRLLRECAPLHLCLQASSWQGSVRLLPLSSRIPIAMATVVPLRSWFGFCFRCTSARELSSVAHAPLSTATSPAQDDASAPHAPCGCRKMNPLSTLEPGRFILACNGERIDGFGQIRKQEHLVPGI